MIAVVTLEMEPYQQKHKASPSSIIIMIIVVIMFFV